MNTAARLGVFAAGLAAAFGVAAGIGAAAGPIDVGGDEPHGGVPHGEEPGGEEPHGGAGGLGGLSSADGGYRIVVERASVPAAVPTPFTFAIEADDGAVLQEYDVLHERELHLVVVSRNLVDYAHVHPVRDVAGRWAADLPALPAGSYRAYADFQPRGGERLTLAVDLAVAGTVAEPMVPMPAHAVAVDGYTVELGGSTTPGSSELAFTITQDGAPVTTEPYLGAAAHLVVIRAGDLGYLHVHAIDGSGPAIRFDAEIPSRGTYRLFLEFSHGGSVHLAPFTVEVGDEHGH